MTREERIKAITDAQEYIIRTSAAIDPELAMDLCKTLQTLKDEIRGGDLRDIDEILEFRSQVEAGEAEYNRLEKAGI